MEESSRELRYYTAVRMAGLGVEIRIWDVRNMKQKSYLLEGEVCFAIN
jgi:hypothetical protein